ncbi:hypothetical protein [Metabacillus litoralis]|uniref:hypothetical protein n=1 Tax=Metabacillus litoralis TaxID=152268 RepID=UPI001CFE41F2|nr:hypothetical protein [Metabacillus litoralis]
MEKDKLFNIKSNWKHSTQEYLIKKLDASQDMSRSAVFERAVKVAVNVKDWNLIQKLLSGLEKNEEAPVFTNFQAKYGEETEEILIDVRDKMLEDLKKSGLKVLQSQYMVLLLQANYIKKLKEEKLSIISETQVDEENVDMPEMVKIFCDMMLTDKDCQEIKTIKKILVEWRNK